MMPIPPVTADGQPSRRAPVAIVARRGLGLGVQVYMRISGALRWFNRHGASSVCLVLLLGFCAGTDFMARLKMRLANMFALMDNRTMLEMRLIELVHAHWWIVANYLVVFFVSLIWLEFRAVPRWAVWITFSILALPLLAYSFACAHISNKVLFVPAAGL